MAFFEQLGKKITDAGQGISQSTKNMAEISRLNSAISENRKHIAGYTAAIGESYYKRHKDDPDNEEPERINNLNRLYAEIAQYEDRIKQLRGIGKCPNCGADVPNGAAFCNACGTRIAQPAQAQAAGVCPNCHAPVAPGNRFCTSCGTMIPASPAGDESEKAEPEQTAPTCPGCGAPVDADSKFCTNCGAKLG